MSRYRFRCGVCNEKLPCTLEVERPNNPKAVTPIKCPFLVRESDWIMEVDSMQKNQPLTIKTLKDNLTLADLIVEGLNIALLEILRICDEKLYFGSNPLEAIKQIAQKAVGETE
jgi:hypothetical protein